MKDQVIRPGPGPWLSHVKVAPLLFQHRVMVFVSGEEVERTWCFGEGGGTAVQKPPRC